jgi:hypothetical protein
MQANDFLALNPHFSRRHPVNPGAMRERRSCHE